MTCRCAVCLGDYQAEDKLQQIPACGHSFHMDCIDHWLATHTTCPLCRLSLLASSKSTHESVDTHQNSSATESTDRTSDQMLTPELSAPIDGDAMIQQSNCEEDERSCVCSDQEGEHSTDCSSEVEENEHNGQIAGEPSVPSDEDATIQQSNCEEDEKSCECLDQGGEHSTNTSSEVEEKENKERTTGIRLSLSTYLFFFFSFYH